MKYINQLIRFLPWKGSNAPDNLYKITVLLSCSVDTGNSWFSSYIQLKIRFFQPWYISSPTSSPSWSPRQLVRPLGSLDYAIVDVCQRCPKLNVTITKYPPNNRAKRWSVAFIMHCELIFSLSLSLTVVAHFKKRLTSSHHKFYVSAKTHRLSKAINK